MEKTRVDHLLRRRRSEETAVAQALVGLKVHFISLVSNPANKRQFIIKALTAGSRRGPQGFVVVQKSVRIIKANKRRRVVYGVVLVPDELDGEKDTISVEEIEKAAYAFMQAGRNQQVDNDHDGEAGKGFVADRAEDLEAAAQGFVSRVVAGLKQHFGDDAQPLRQNGKGYRELTMRL